MMPLMKIVEQIKGYDDYSFYFSDIFSFIQKTLPNISYVILKKALNTLVFKDYLMLCNGKFYKTRYLKFL